MKDIIEAFAPSGEEGALREILMNRFRKLFDEFSIDNMGNLIAKSGGGGLCIECGMDSLGVMVVSKDESGVRFAPVGDLKVKNTVGRTVVFADGVAGEVCCDEEKTEESARIADLYINLKDTDNVEIGDFGGFSTEFEEEECAYSGYGIGNRIGLAAVCKALGNVDELCDITVLFSAQKRLGGRGLSAYLRVNSFERIVTIDKNEDDGCTIIAKDERAVSNPQLRKMLESIAEKRDVLADTIVCSKNFFMEQISVACGDPCAAIGIGLICEDGEKERVNKSDFEGAVSLITGLLKGEC